MDTNLRERAEEYMKKDPFRSSAFLIIQKMVSSIQTHPSVLVDECLHSIFFAGKIHKPKYVPEEIVTNDEMMTLLKKHYSRPLELSSTQLPKRSPFSCVLDLLVHLIRREASWEEEEHKVRESLQKFIKTLKEKNATDLISSTICVSQIKQDSNSQRYYGVSMSTFNRVHGQIMVAVSCLSTWDSYVADAVMTYNPNRTRRNYFDGTLQLQELIRCEAFSLGRGERMDPCRSCGNLFGLTTEVTQEWPYGHCAEAESINNLLKSESAVRRKAKPKSEKCTDENRQRAKDSILKDLKNFLGDTVFKGWESGFYTP